ncbi:hypothetical protein NA78x_001724 [Anatilimnocola sp. NA78]|uniref:hypothetical protein n=1 Tax=Anatilimnocola sp. NA78 TaxID=3415683 RepID=UPI003CE4C2C2
MAEKRAGYEFTIAYGPAGATATTPITNSIDVTDEFVTEKGETTVRGDGTAPPVKAFRVVAREKKVTFQMLMKTDDTTLAALLAASYAGTPVALRTKAHATGLGTNADFILEHSKGAPLKGMQTVDFTCEINDDLRAAQFNV